MKATLKPSRAENDKEIDKRRKRLRTFGMVWLKALPSLSTIMSRMESTEKTSK